MTTSYRPSWVQINVFEPQMRAVPGQAYSRASRRGPFQELRAADQDADDPEVAGFTLMRQDAPEGSTLWIHDDEQGDVEAVIRFVLRLAEGLNLTGLGVPVCPEDGIIANEYTFTAGGRRFG